MLFFHGVCRIAPLIRPRPSSDLLFIFPSVFCSVLKNDSDTDNRRRCIISFAAAGNAVGDHMKFLFGKNSRKAGYCGRYGIHAGVSDELWQITHDDQYSDIIKPALETCHEVTCVGFSLGGSLCNIFTMCANMGENNLDMADGEGERTRNEKKKNYLHYLFISMTSSFVLCVQLQKCMMTTTLLRGRRLSLSTKKKTKPGGDNFAQLLLS